jgi:hypothetical protein
MDSYDFDVRLTPAARELLRPAGEASLYAAGEEGLSRRKGLIRLKGEDPIYAARAIFPHLAGRVIKLDARKTFGVRRFSSDLPRDFGLRAVMGYLPEGS